MSLDRGVRKILWNSKLTSLRVPILNSSKKTSITWLRIIWALQTVSLKGLFVQNLMMSGTSTRAIQKIALQQIEATCWLIRVRGWSLPNLSYQMIPYRRTMSTIVKKVLKKLFVINYKPGFRFFKGLIQIYIVVGFQLMSKVLFTVLLYSEFQLKTHQIVNPKLFPPEWDSASWRKFIGEESFKKGDSIFLKILLVKLNSDNWKNLWQINLKNFKIFSNIL